MNLSCPLSIRVDHSELSLCVCVCVCVCVRVCVWWVKDYARVGGAASYKILALYIYSVLAHSFSTVTVDIHN